MSRQSYGTDNSEYGINDILDERLRITNATTEKDSHYVSPSGHRELNEQELNEQELKTSSPIEQLDNSLIKKADKLLLNNGWNNENEKIVMTIGENSIAYKILHETQSRRYTLYHNIHRIMLILLTSFLSLETINTEDSETLRIVRDLITYLVSILTILGTFFLFEQKSEIHKTTSKKLSQLYNNIREQMATFRRDREHGSIYLKNVAKTYDSLVMEAPNLQESIIKTFKKKFDKSDISLPDIADNIQKIDIVSENQQINRTLDFSSPNTKHLAQHGICNLKSVHDAVQIHGDINDHDIANANQHELDNLIKKNFFKNADKNNFEMQRFNDHINNE